MHKPRNPIERLDGAQRIHPEEHAAALRAKWVYVKKLKRCAAELDDTKDRLLVALECRARFETALADAAHAIEAGSASADVLTSIRIALHATQGGKTL